MPPASRCLPSSSCASPCGALRIHSATPSAISKTRPPSRRLVSDTDRVLLPAAVLHLAVGLWHGASSIDAALTTIRFLHLVPIVLLVRCCSCTCVRATASTPQRQRWPSRRSSAPGFRDNLELPFSYTIVGMPVVLAVWLLLEARASPVARPRHPALTTDGHRIQGARPVIVPLIVAAWWLGSPGATRGMAAPATVGAIAYVALRLYIHDERLPMFEQDVGFGFTRCRRRMRRRASAHFRSGSSPTAAPARSPTCSLPNRPTASSASSAPGKTARSSHGMWPRSRRRSADSAHRLVGRQRVAARRERPLVARRAALSLMLVVLLATGALSFNYSRDRLGGMAVPLYAVAAFHAVRAMAARAPVARPRRSLPAVAAASCCCPRHGVAAARAPHDREHPPARDQHRTRMGDSFPERRAEVAHRTVYRGIMDGMLSQGTSPEAVRRTRYPRWLRPDGRGVLTDRVQRPHSADRA